MGLIIKNGIEYIGGGGSGNALEVVLTQAEYDALGDEKYTDDITYYITDSEELSAHNIEFDGSKINMKVTSVQEAIEQIYNLNSDIVITLDKDEWVLDEETGLYRQDIEMDGLTGKEVPIMILTSNSDEAKAAWAKANNPEIKEGLISFYADEDIDVELTVVAKGMVTKPTNTVVDVTEIKNDIKAIETRTEAVETLAAAADNKADENANAINDLENTMSNKVDNNDSRLTDARQPLEHNHDDRYYTETEIDSKVNTINQAVNGNTEAISKLNSDLIPSETINTLPTPTKECVYFVSEADSTFPYQWGILEIRYGSYTGEFFATFKTTGFDNRIYHNTYRAGAWVGWEKLTTNSDLSDWIDITKNCTWNVTIATEGVYRSFVKYNKCTKQLIGCVQTADAIGNQTAILTLPSDLPYYTYYGLCGIAHVTTTDAGVVTPRIEGSNIYSSHFHNAGITGALYLIDCILD